jgi:hypothetical protein
MNRMWIAAAAGAVLLGGAGAASAQAMIVDDYAYGPPVYVAPAPVYPAPVVVAPPPRVYVAPAPVYAAPPIRAHRFTREVVVTESAPEWTPPGVVYPDW